MVCIAAHTPTKVKGPKAKSFRTFDPEVNIDRDHPDMVGMIHDTRHSAIVACPGKPVTHRAAWTPHIDDFRKGRFLGLGQKDLASTEPRTLKSKGRIPSPPKKPCMWGAAVPDTSTCWHAAERYTSRCTPSACYALKHKDLDIRRPKHGPMWGKEVVGGSRRAIVA